MLFKTAIKATGRLAENIASVASVMQPMVMAALVLPIPYISIYVQNFGEVASVLSASKGNAH